MKDEEQKELLELSDRSLKQSLEEVQRGFIYFTQSCSGKAIRLMRTILRIPVVKDALGGSLYLLRGLMNRVKRLTKNTTDDRLDMLEAQLKEIRTLLEWGRKIDLVNCGSFAVFMFMDDWAYNQLPEESKGYSIAAHAQRVMSGGGVNGSSHEFSIEKINKNNIKFLLLKHYWSHNLPFVFLYVGCNYGVSALELAAFIKYHGHTNKLVCFDPGLAGLLVPHNISINALDDIVTFEPLAVSDHSLPCIIFSEIGHSENNRIINPDIRAGTEAGSWVARSISVDQYVVQNDISENLILIIDTQGGDYEVVQGMKSVNQSRYVSFMIEFFPLGLEPRVAPIDFLNMIGMDAYLFDLPEKDKAIREIKASEYSDFIDEVDSYEGKWTDILVIPKKLPGSDALRNDILVKRVN